MSLWSSWLTYAILHAFLVCFQIVHDTPIHHHFFLYTIFNMLIGWSQVENIGALDGWEQAIAVSKRHLYTVRTYENTKQPPSSIMIPCLCISSCGIIFHHLSFLRHLFYNSLVNLLIIFITCGLTQWTINFFPWVPGGCRLLAVIMIVTRSDILDSLFLEFDCGGRGFWPVSLQSMFSTILRTAMK